MRLHHHRETAAAALQDAGFAAAFVADPDGTTPWRRRTSLVLLASMVALLLPATTSWAYVEVDQLVEDTVQPTSGPGRSPTSANAVASTTVVPAQAFSMVGATAPHDVQVEVRVQGPDDAWSEWLLLPSEADHAGDHGDEASLEDGRIATDPIFVDHGVALQVRVVGGVPEDVEVTVLDAHGRSGADPERIRVPASQAAAADDRPAIISRSTWGAAAPADDIVHATAEWYVDDEDDEDDDAPYVDLGPAKDVLGAGVIHHTASHTVYDADEVAGIIRGTQRYHQTGRGWDDIGYNFLVDRFGRIWEGRAGGVDRAVVGAHAGGWNATSFGVALLGDFRDGVLPTSAALDATVDLVAWKFVLHGVDPYATHRWPNGGSRRTLIGHSEVRQTTCPAGVLALLPGLRDRIAAAMDGLEVDRWWETEEEEVPAASFSDVDPGSVHAEDIVVLAEAGVILGCGDGTFCPELAVTRGQIASLFAKAFQLPAEEGDPPFHDVATRSPHRDWIRALVDRGAIAGFPDNTYRSRLPITRGQAAAIVGRTLGLDKVGGWRFRDVSDSDLAGWIYAMEKVGLMEGCEDDAFCPSVEMTRAQIATLLRDSVRYAQAEGLTIAPDTDLSGDPAP